MQEKELLESLIVINCEIHFPYLFAGCEGRGTAETNYQCPICIGIGAPPPPNKGKREQQQGRLTSSPAVFEEGNSRFYVEGVDLSSSDEGNDLQGGQGHDLFLPEIVAENLNMTVKLPDKVAVVDKVFTNNGHHEDAVDAAVVGGKTRPCRFAGCDFYGTPEMHYLCSKCFAKVENPRSKGVGKKVY